MIGRLYSATSLADIDAGGLGSHSTARTGRYDPPGLTEDKAWGGDADSRQ